MEIGDVVRLKSGGPLMTVASGDETGTTCAWFSGDEMVAKFFQPGLLEPYVSDKDLFADGRATGVEHAVLAINTAYRRAANDKEIHITSCLLEIIRGLKEVEPEAEKPDEGVLRASIEAFASNLVTGSGEHQGVLDAVTKTLKAILRNTKP